MCIQLPVIECGLVCIQTHTGMLPAKFYNQRSCHTGFKYPVTLSGLGQGFSAIAAFVACRVLKVVPVEKRVDAEFFMMRMLPIGFFNATTLMFGNAVYMFLSVSFIQMLKAFTPVITMVGLFLASLEVILYFCALSCLRLT
jgi:hypothetical protein